VDVCKDWEDALIVDRPLEKITK